MDIINRNFVTLSPVEISGAPVYGIQSSNHANSLEANTIISDREESTEPPSYASIFPSEIPMCQCDKN